MIKFSWGWGGQVVRPSMIAPYLHCWSRMISVIYNHMKIHWWHQYYVPSISNCAEYTTKEIISPMRFHVCVNSHIFVLVIHSFLPQAIFSIVVYRRKNLGLLFLVQWHYHFRFFFPSVDNGTVPWFQMFSIVWFFFRALHLSYFFLCELQ